MSALSSATFWMHTVGTTHVYRLQLLMIIVELDNFPLSNRRDRIGRLDGQSIKCESSDRIKPDFIAFKFECTDSGNRDIKASYTKNH